MAPSCRNLLSHISSNILKVLAGRREKRGNVYLSGIRRFVRRSEDTLVKGKRDVDQNGQVRDGSKMVTWLKLRQVQVFHTALECKMMAVSRSKAAYSYNHCYCGKPCGSYSALHHLS